MTALPVVSDSMDSYLVEINRFPQLTREEEYDLSVDYYENGNLESAHKLVVSNLRFVVKLALKYRSYGCSLKDLVQEGNLGLMTAVKKFNPYKGFRVITYAAWWIKACIQDFILKTRGTVKRDFRALKKKLFYKNAGTDGQKALEADCNIGATDLSLNATIGDGENTTHLDMLEDTSPGQAELYAASEDKADKKEKVALALSRLTDKERFVMENRFMKDEPLSLQSIGDTLGLSRERIRQIEKGSLEKLREVMGREPHALAPGAP